VDKKTSLFYPKNLPLALHGIIMASYFSQIFINNYPTKTPMFYEPFRQAAGIKPINNFFPPIYDFVPD
jgi:hypothetical protein